MVLAGETLPDINSKAMQSQVRKAVHEVMNAEMVSTCWISNVQYVADTLRLTLVGKKLNGYVQRFNVSFCLA